MIERMDGALQVYCDFCCYSEEYRRHRFEQVIAIIKKRGWRISREDDEWIHRCPLCNEDKVK